jgi:hypothetical protein
LHCRCLLQDAFHIGEGILHQVNSERVTIMQKTNAPASSINPASESRGRCTQAQSVRDLPEIKLALLTEQELGERWRMSIRTLQGWRQRKTGPNFVKIRGQAVRYPMNDVLAYESQWK